MSRNSRGKIAISVRATEGLLYSLFCGVYMLGATAVVWNYMSAKIKIHNSIFSTGIRSSRVAPPVRLAVSVFSKTDNFR